MKIVFMGTPAFSVPCLARLVTDENPGSVTLEEVFLTLTGKKLRDYAGGEG